MSALVLEQLSDIEITALPCRRNPPDIFFADQPSAVEQAKALCQPCPIRQQCLAGAQDRQEPWGVWGGELFLNGVVVAQKRGRGRPRKPAVGVAA